MELAVLGGETPGFLGALSGRSAGGLGEVTTVVLGDAALVFHAGVLISVLSLVSMVRVVSLVSVPSPVLAGDRWSASRPLLVRLTSGESVVFGTGATRAEGLRL